MQQVKVIFLSCSSHGDLYKPCKWQQIIFKQSYGQKQINVMKNLFQKEKKPFDERITIGFFFSFILLA